MEYKASLDTSAKVITTVALLLFTYLGYRSIVAIQNSEDLRVTLTHSGVLLLLCSILLVCYLFAPQSYKIDDTSLTIVRPISNNKILLADIKNVRSIDAADTGGALRTFGVGGLFGYFGRFNYDKIGNVTMYATQSANKVLLTTKEGKKIIITPDDREGLVEELKYLSTPQSA